MILRKITLIASIAFLLASCSEEPIENRELKEYFSSYLNDNEDVIAFGNAKITSILNKAQYDKVMMLKMIIGEQLSTFKGLIDLDGSVYYTANAPLNNDAAPEEIVMFIEVVDAEKLKKHLSAEMSYDINEAKGFSYTADGDMSLGIRGNLVIILIKPGVYNEEEELAAAFEKVDGKESKGDIADLLKVDDGDFVSAVNVGNFVLNSESHMGDLSTTKKAELKKLFTGAFVNTSVKFEDGRAVIETTNHFSKELKSKMFFESDPSAAVLSDLGGGSPIAGFCMNIDLDKMETFMNDLHPQALNKLGGMNYVGLKFIAGTNNLGDMISGKAGMLFFDEPGNGDFPILMNSYVGLESKGEKVIDNIVENFGEFIPRGIPDYSIKNGGVTISGNKSDASKGLTIPAMAKGFGEAGMSFFVNLENLTEEKLTELAGSSKYGPILKVAKFISFEYNNEGGKLIITAKDGKSNILKQSLEAGMENISELVGGVSF
ncbi:MAG: hypothetical protein ACI865_000531 [Flavobacteriaceae bacterium]|jgi:hypothetical protein